MILYLLVLNSTKPIRINYTCSHSIKRVHNTKCNGLMYYISKFYNA